MIAGSPPQRRQAVLQSDRHDAARRRQARSAQPGRDAAEHASPERQGYEPRDIEDPDRAAREIRRGLGGEAEGERGDEGEIPYRKRARDLARGLREMLEAVFVPLQRREHRQQCDERPHRSHGFDSRLNSQGEEAVEGARCIGGADDRRRVDEDAEIDESERRERLHHPAQAPASFDAARARPTQRGLPEPRDRPRPAHALLLPQFGTTFFVRRGPRGVGARSPQSPCRAGTRESRGAPSRIGRRRGCGAGRQLFREVEPHVRRIDTAGNHPGRDEPTCAAPGRAAKACGADANVRVRAALLEVTGV